MQSPKHFHVIPSVRCRSTCVFLLSAMLLLLACHASVAQAQITSKDLSDPSLTDAERKQMTLLWLDKYLKDSVLLDKDDSGKIRAAVEQMSPSQLQQWLKQTQELGDYVDSPQWQDTKRWLAGFLRVQAIYSDQEIAKLKNDIRNADSDQLLAILKRIQAKHESLVWMHQASKQTRSVEVQQRNAAVAQQAAANQKSRSSSTANLPLFGSGVAKTQKPSKGYRPPGPLINSREVARAAVWSEVWGGGRRGF